jgi:hypothetical protein
MEARHDESAATDPAAEQPKKMARITRFEILKLEERITPGHGGTQGNLHGHLHTGIRCRYTTATSY